MPKSGSGESRVWPKVILVKVVQASHDSDTMKTMGQDESLLLFV